MKKLIGISAAFILCYGIAIYFLARDVFHIDKNIADDIYFYPLCAGVVLLSLYAISKKEIDIIFEITAILFFVLFVVFGIKDYIMPIRIDGIQIVIIGFSICLVWAIFRHKIF